MTLDVLVTAAFPEAYLERIRGLSPEIRMTYAPLKKDEPLPKNSLLTAEVLYTWTVLPNPEEAPNLRWVQTHMAGIDLFKDHPLLDRSVAITTLSGIHVVQIAEYVMTSILAWSHRFPRMLAYQKQGVWPKGRWEKFVPQTLRGKTIGIVGYGSIGREIARLAKSFGMQVLAAKRDARRVAAEGYQISGTGDSTGDIPDRIYPASAITSMLAECDYVVLSLPLTVVTQHLIDRDKLRAMKTTAYLVNISRGKLIDEAELIEALRNGWIAGAGLDVFDTEPLPADNPLWKMDNAILSPHVAGFSPDYDQRAIDVFIRNLQNYLEGRPLLNLVDRERGY
jgi:phosphoglycerate dehydrogenase-like enzyme